MIIREATPDDIYVISFLGSQFVNRSITSKFMSFNQINFHSTLNNYIDNNVLKIWVARDGYKLAGAVGLIYSQNFYNSDETLGDIYFIDVLPEYQKQGLAGKFITTVEQWCSENGVQSLSISFKSKEIAERVSESKGFDMFEYKLMKRVGGK